MFMGPGLVGGGVKVAPPSRLRERGVACDGQMPGGGQAERRPPQLVSRRFIRCLSEPPGERGEVRRRPVRPAGTPLVKQAARVDELLDRGRRGLPQQLYGRSRTISTGRPRTGCWLVFVGQITVLS